MDGRDIYSLLIGEIEGSDHFKDLGIDCRKNI
jgi:hypothetical protein